MLSQLKHFVLPPTQSCLLTATTWYTLGHQNQKVHKPFLTQQFLAVDLNTAPKLISTFIVGSERINSAKLLIFMLILQTSWTIYSLYLTFFTSGVLNSLQNEKTACEKSSKNDLSVVCCVCRDAVSCPTLLLKL